MFKLEGNKGKRRLPLSGTQFISIKAKRSDIFRYYSYMYDYLCNISVNASILGDEKDYHHSDVKCRKLSHNSSKKHTWNSKNRIWDDIDAEVLHQRYVQMLILIAMP